MADTAKPMDEIHREAMDRFDRSYEYERKNRDDGLDDARFRAGDHWPADIKNEWEKDGRVILTINRIPQFTRQVVNDIRQSLPGIKIRPYDDKSDPETAKVFTGLIRNIENNSEAGIAYVTAVENAVNVGFGDFRITTFYNDDDTFEQDIGVERIRNPFSVYWDPDADQPHKGDAWYVFITEWMTKDRFEREFPGEEVSSFESYQPGNRTAQWIKDEEIQVAEYWCKKKVKKTLALALDGTVIEADGISDDQWPELVARDDSGYITREVETVEVCQYFVSGKGIIGDPYVWPSKYLPVVHVSGEEVNVGDEVITHGIVRYAKDAQRMFNYWTSANTDRIAREPKAPWLGTPKMFSGLEAIWEDANKRDFPFLPFNGDPDFPNLMPQRQAMPPISPGMVQLIDAADKNMKATTGIYDEGVGDQSNAVAGVAIRQRTQESDVSTFAYPDNLAISVRQAGRILLDLIPRIYTGERVMRIINEDESEEFVPINREVKGRDGEILIHDLSRGKYDVTVTTGPSYTTKRQEAAEHLSTLLQGNPDLMNVIGDLVFKSQDWPGADEISERMRKMLPDGLVEPKEGDEPRQPKPPDPMAIMQVHRMQAEVAELRAKTAKLEADAMHSQAEAVKTAAEAAGENLDNKGKSVELSGMTGELETAIMQLINRRLAEIQGTQ